jgi:antitoxin component YwqK of YwqJK toxin-antitoxin module
MKRLLPIALFLICITGMQAQKFSDQVPQMKRYTVAEIVDPEYGIIRYNKLVPGEGGDSIRYTKDGYNAQGWQEDYYVSGKLLHKGFYVDGQIKIYKNFYENGQVERTYTSTDMRHSKLEIYYEDGKVRSMIQYYDGNAQNEYDYFKNGAPEYVEENDKDMEYLYKRNSFSESGQPISSFELVDKKSKKYIKKEFYESGHIKEEGTMYYHKELGDYQKEGVWTYYDDKGNVTKTEKYHNNQLE